MFSIKVEKGKMSFSMKKVLLFHGLVELFS
jgi:hypothetical protein